MLVGDLVRPADDELVDIGEALARGEGRPAVDERRSRSPARGQARRGRRRPPPRRRRPAAGGPGRPPRRAAARPARRPSRCRSRAQPSRPRRAQRRPAAHPASPRAGRPRGPPAARRRRSRPQLARRRGRHRASPRGRTVTIGTRRRGDRGPWPVAASSAAAGMAGCTSTSMVPPQARPTSQASESLMPKRTTRCSPGSGRRLHVLGGGAFHAATADRTGDASVGRAQHGGALAARRRAEGADDHRAGDAPGPRAVQASTVGSSSLMPPPRSAARCRRPASRWTRGTPLRSGRRLRWSAISASSSPSRCRARPGRGRPRGRR